MNKVVLSEEYAMSCFSGDLKEDVQYTIRMVAPKTLRQAIGLVKLQEGALDSRYRKSRPTSRSAPILPTPKLHPEETNARGDKGGN